MVNNNNHEPPAKPDNYDCSDILALIPAYSIGATDADETRIVEAALHTCPEAVAELADYLALSDAMLFAPQHAADPKRSTQPLPVSTIPRLSLVPKPTATKKPRGWYTWANRLAILAAAAVLILTNLYWFNRTTALQDQQDRLAKALAEQTAIFNALGKAKPHHQELMSTQGDPARAIVIWDGERQIGTMYAVGLPPLSADRAYQLWIAKPNYEVSLGVFKVDANGTGTLVFRSPEPIIDFEAIGVSIEPATGSDHPTTPMGILGKISRS
jgi:anti-sigma-K factor RskA